MLLRTTWLEFIFIYVLLCSTCYVHNSLIEMSVVLWQKWSLCRISNAFFFSSWPTKPSSSKSASFIHIILVNIICIVFNLCASMASCAHHIQWYFLLFFQMLNRSSITCLLETWSYNVMCQKCIQFPFRRDIHFIHHIVFLQSSYRIVMVVVSRGYIAGPLAATEAKRS